MTSEFIWAPPVESICRGGSGHQQGGWLVDGYQDIKEHRLGQSPEPRILASSPDHRSYPMSSFLYECLQATRPYSFTTVVVPVFLTAAIAGNRDPAVFLTTEFARSLVMGLTVLAGANLTNTCTLSFEICVIQ